MSKLKAEISSAEYSGLSDQQIADILNNQVVVQKVFYVTDRTILSHLGAEKGSAFLDELESLSLSMSPIKWALRSISTNGIDITNPETLGVLNSLALDPNITGITTTDVDKLKSLSETTTTTLADSLKEPRKATTP